MNANIIARHIGIGMLAFCATFVQTSMFATAHFGGVASAQSVRTAQVELAYTRTAVNKETDSRRS
jgi:hypothetical protein